MLARCDTRPAVTTAMATVIVGALLIAGCSGSAGSGSGASAAGSAVAGGPITVTADDTSCAVTASAAVAGTITFQVQNAGSKVNEFYLYAPGDRIIGEIENITPGLSRELRVEVSEPGSFQTACKPGMVGDGIRAAFQVTGRAVTGSTDQQVAKAIDDYRQYVAGEADLLVSGTTAFVEAVKAKDGAKAKALYAVARSPWEHIEPVAESFGDLDPKIDGRADVVSDGMAFTGYHRLEKDLWVEGLQPDSPAVADQLLADVKTISDRARAVDFTAVAVANGAKTLLDEVAKTKITGEEERYSHTDLTDMKGNLQGSQAALQALRPVLGERDPALVISLDTAFSAINRELDRHRDGSAAPATGSTGSGEATSYVPLDRLTPQDVKALSVALDALSEQVARTPAAVQSP